MTPFLWCMAGLAVGALALFVVALLVIIERGEP